MPGVSTLLPATARLCLPRFVCLRRHPSASPWPPNQHRFRRGVLFCNSGVIDDALTTLMESSGGQTIPDCAILRQTAENNRAVQDMICIKPE